MDTETKRYMEICAQYKAQNGLRLREQFRKRYERRREYFRKRYERRREYHLNYRREYDKKRRKPSVRAQYRYNRPAPRIERHLASVFPEKFQHRQFLSLGRNEKGRIERIEVDNVYWGSDKSIIVECDERQHILYGFSTSTGKFNKYHPKHQGWRYRKLQEYCLAKNKGAVVIRINPDDIKKFKATLEERLVKLEEKIMFYLSCEFTPESFVVDYMYFEEDWKHTCESHRLDPDF